MHKQDIRKDDDTSSRQGLEGLTLLDPLPLLQPLNSPDIHHMLQSTPAEQYVEVLHDTTETFLQSPSWDEIKHALSKPSVSDIISALRNLGVDLRDLSDVIANYCFSEDAVWQEGRHTVLSHDRSMVVIEALFRILPSFTNFADEDGGMAYERERLCRALLKGTAGPKQWLEGIGLVFDPRASYRSKLVKIAEEVEQGFKAMFNERYASLQKLAVDNLAGTRAPNEAAATYFVETLPKDWLAEEFSTQGPFVALGLNPRLYARVVPPSWLHERDLQGAFERLPGDDKHDWIDIASRIRDWAHQKLPLLAGPCLELIDEGDLIMAGLYAEWLRRAYDRTMAQTYSSIQEAIGPMAVENDNFFSRTMPKGLPRTLAKMFEQLKDIGETVNTNKDFSELRKTDAEQLRSLLREVAGTTKDVASCTFIAKNVEELAHACQVLQSFKKTGFHPVQIKNGFSKSFTPGVFEWRDVKIYLEYEAKLCGNILVEVILNLESWYKLKEKMHLPYVLMKDCADYDAVVELVNDNSMAKVVSEAATAMESIVSVEARARILELQADLFKMYREGNLMACRAKLKEIHKFAQGQSNRLAAVLEAVIKKTQLDGNRYQFVKDIRSVDKKVLQVLPPAYAGRWEESMKYLCLEAHWLAPEFRHKFLLLVDTLNRARDIEEVCQIFKLDKKRWKHPLRVKAFKLKGATLDPPEVVRVSFGPEKNMDRLREKAQQWGLAGCTDLLRLTLEFADPYVLALCFWILHGILGDMLVRCNNKFSQQKCVQPPNLHLNIVFQGHIAEVQLILEEVLEVKHEMHAWYELERAKDFEIALRSVFPLLPHGQSTFSASPEGYLEQLSNKKCVIQSRIGAADFAEHRVKLAKDEPEDKPFEFPAPCNTVKSLDEHGECLVQ